METVLRLVFGGLFVWASVDKLLHPADFAQAVFNYQLLPDALVNAAALYLPMLELVCGLALVAGVGRRGAALTLCLLTVIFMAALGFNLWRGLSVDCGCFSVKGGGMHPGLALLRDAGILLLGLSVFQDSLRSRTIFYRS